MNRVRRFFQGEHVGILFILPALAYMCYFVIYPIISNIALSMQDVNVMTLLSPNKPFVGLRHYVELFKDPVLLKSISNTLLFTVCSIVVQFVIGFTLALFFCKQFSFSKPVRGLLMIPWMIPVTITTLIFKFMFTSNVGIVNQALMGINLIDKPIDWLIQPGTVRPFSNCRTINHSV